jgi:hypothetical protein
MFAGKITATALSKAVASSKPIADLCICYNEGIADTRADRRGLRPTRGRGTVLPMAAANP